jgi:Glycosyltransferase family 87
VADERSEDIERDDAQWASNVAAAAIIGFSVAWVLVLFLAEHGLYGSPERTLEVNLYRGYAQQLLNGLMPYRDFDFEYPPLALLPMLAPVLLTGAPLGEPSYRQAFVLVMAGIGMVTMLLVMRAAVALELGRRDMVAGGIVVALSPILLGPLLLARFDLWPALFAAAAIWLYVTGRERWSAVALGLGALAKVYPIVLGPFIVVHLWRTRGRRAALAFTVIAGAVVAIGLAPFFLASPDGVVEALRRAFVRPLQVEAIGAATLFFVGVFVDLPHSVLVHTFDSYNLVSPLADQVSFVQTMVLALLLGVALVLFARGRPTLDRLVLACGTGLCAYVAFGKVLSPQYLVWLIAPLVLIAGRRWSLHLLALTGAVLLTGLFFPRFYSNYIFDREPLWVAVVLGRDLVLAVLALYLVAGLASRGAAVSPRPRSVVPSRA